VAEPEPGRYSQHDLLRAYAAELTQQADSADQRLAAQRRMLDHYLHAAHAAAARHTVNDPITIPTVQEGAVLVEPEDGLAWFTAEYGVLLPVIRSAAEGEWDEHVIALVQCVHRFLDFQGHWRDMMEVLQLCLQAARRQGDRAQAAFAHRTMATAALPLGEPAQARRHLYDALRLSRAMGDEPNLAHTHMRLAWLMAEDDELDLAMRHGQQALGHYQRANHQRGLAHALNAMGWFYSRLGEPVRTIEHAEKALRIFEELEDRDGAAATWDTLGSAHQALGQHTHAVGCFTRAVELVRQLGNRYYEALGLSHLGDARQAAGDADSARASWRAAVAILDDLAHPEAAEVRAKLELLAV
jgi:tetratricopeptide (TPR) repeat protein